MLKQGYGSRITARSGSIHNNLKVIRDQRRGRRSSVRTRMGTRRASGRSGMVQASHAIQATSPKASTVIDVSQSTYDPKIVTEFGRVESRIHPQCENPMILIG